MSKKETSENQKKSPNVLLKLLKLYRFLVPYKWYFLAGLVFLFLSSATTLAFPFLLGDFFDQGSSKDIHKLGAILLAVFFANAIFSYFRILLFEIVAQNTLASIRKEVYSHLIRLQMDFFANRRVGELNSRLASDVTVLQTTFTTTSAEFLRQIFTIIGGLVMLSAISYQLTLFMLAIVPVIAIIAVIFGRFIRKLSKETQNKLADSNTIVEETLQGIFNVKAFANERFEISRYSNTIKDVVSLGIKNAKFRGAFVSFIIFGLFGSIIGVIWYGLILREAGEISDGDLFSFVLYTVFVGASIGGIADLYSQLIKAVGATENVFEILEESPEDIKPNETPEQLTISGSITFKNLSFSYPSRPDASVLKDISLDIPAGKQFAIVGPSGAGKSTLAALILRFYTPTNGDVLIDGKSITSYDITALRNCMAVVPQEVLLFGGTIKENIMYGNPNAVEEEIIAAAEKANAMEFIEKMEDGFETVVGERGVQLSGGQKQRIAIARAVLKNPSILILDEATSSLDSTSELLVQEALEKLMKGRTSVVIAHRLSTIKNADQIVVIKAGAIAEKGTHEELRGKENGEYAKLSMHQFDSTNT